MKADYGAVPLAEAKAELVDDVNVRPSQDGESSRYRKIGLLLIFILLLVGWIIFRGSSNDSSPTKGSATQPLVVPSGPSVEDSNAPVPLGPKGLKKSEKKKGPPKSDPKKASPKKIPSMKGSKKSPKSPKKSPKSKKTKSKKN